MEDVDWVVDKDKFCIGLGPMKSGGGTVQERLDDGRERT